MLKECSLLSQYHCITVWLHFSMLKNMKIKPAIWWPMAQISLELWLCPWVSIWLGLLEGVVSQSVITARAGDWLILCQCILYCDRYYQFLWGVYKHLWQGIVTNWFSWTFLINLFTQNNHEQNSCCKKHSNNNNKIFPCPTEENRYYCTLLLSTINLKLMVEYFLLFFAPLFLSHYDSGHIIVFLLFLILLFSLFSAWFLSYSCGFTRQNRNCEIAPRSWV